MYCLYPVLLVAHNVLAGVLVLVLVLPLFLLLSWFHHIRFLLWSYLPGICSISGTGLLCPTNILTATASSTIYPHWRVIELGEYCIDGLELQFGWPMCFFELPTTAAALSCGSSRGVWAPFPIPLLSSLSPPLLSSGLSYLFLRRGREWKGGWDCSWTVVLYYYAQGNNNRLSSVTPCLTITVEPLS